MGDKDSQSVKSFVSCAPNSQSQDNEDPALAESGSEGIDQQHQGHPQRPTMSLPLSEPISCTNGSGHRVSRSETVSGSVQETSHKVNGEGDSPKASAENSLMVSGTYSSNVPQLKTENRNLAGIDQNLPPKELPESNSERHDGQSSGGSDTSSTSSDIPTGENFKYGPPITDTSGQLFIEIERYEWYTNICEHTNIPHRDERSITFKYLRSKLKKFKGMPTKFNLEVLLYYGGYEGDRNERYSTLVIYLKSSEKQRFLPNFKYEWKLSAKVLDNMAGSQQILGSAIGELTEFDPTKRATAILHRLVHRDKIFDSFNKYLEVQLEVEVVCTERVTYLPINIREIESEDPEMAVYEQY